MKVALITGSAGLVGSEAVSFLYDKFDIILGIDNNMREYFFGKDSSVNWNKDKIIQAFNNYKHFDIDIRNFEVLEKLFKEYNSTIDLIIHAAAQPSHDWAAKEPLTDYSINSTGTANLLELTRLHCPKAVFIFTSTNKVYGDNPNNLPLVEHEDRFEIDQDHKYFKNGIDESFSIDNTKHSIFGASKVSADILCQEYGKYFGLKTGIFRGGCLTGPNHSGAKLHGFLSYLMKCAITSTEYTILGYQGKQVRDNIHSKDLIRMFWNFYLTPKKGEVYNVGGSRFSNCSILEAIKLSEAITGKKFNSSYSEENRIGDHIWWISDTTKFKKDYPQWNQEYDISKILIELFEEIKLRN